MNERFTVDPLWRSHSLEEFSLLGEKGVFGLETAEKDEKDAFTDLTVSRPAGFCVCQTLLDIMRLIVSAEKAANIQPASL